MTMKPGTLILNVTFHPERSALRDVAYFLRHRLVPDWRSAWGEGGVTLLGLPGEEGFAVQITSEDPERLSAFDPSSDPDVRRILEVYPGMVTFFPTLLKVLE